MWAYHSTPKNGNATVISETLLKLFKGWDIQYMSIDPVMQTEDAEYYTPFTLILKVGASVILLHNLDPQKLCSSIRLWLKAIHKSVIEDTINTLVILIWTHMKWDIKPQIRPIRAE